MSKPDGGDSAKSDRGHDARTKALLEAFDQFERAKKAQRRKPTDRTATHQAYVKWVKRYLKAARADSDIPFDELSVKLLDYEVEITGQSLRNKLNEATLSFAQALMILDALGVKNIKVPAIAEAMRALEADSEGL